MAEVLRERTQERGLTYASFAADEDDFPLKTALHRLKGTVEGRQFAGQLQEVGSTGREREPPQPGARPPMMHRTGRRYKRGPRGSKTQPAGMWDHSAKPPPRAGKHEPTERCSG